MTERKYIYQDRAVVFLDLLGFQEKLSEFESEAITYSDEDDQGYMYSEGVSDFITTFKSVVSILDEKNFNYYLFSDNICITVDYAENHNLLIEILSVVNDLYFKFAEKGYFLRGGLDVGKFVVDATIAVGKPLANAYKLERDIAMFPRIVLSENYKNLLDHFEHEKQISQESINKKQFLIKQHCEVYYINTFFNLLGNENILDLLETLRGSITSNLAASNRNEKVAIKYEWLVKEFNLFIEEYITELMFLEATFILDPAETKKIESLKI